MGNNGGCGQFITRSLCCSFLLRGKTPRTLPLLQREVPLMGDSSPPTSPMWVLPMGCSSSRTAPAWVLPMESQDLPANLFWHGLLSPRGSASPARSPLQRGLSMGSQLPSGIHLLQRGVPSTGYRRMSVPPWTSMDCRGTACLTMVFIKSCKGRVCALTFRAPPPPSCLTDLGVCGVVSLTFSLLSLDCCLIAVVYSSLS